MGLKHSGKTTFARLHSERCKVLFSDADHLVQKLIEPQSIRDYYRTNGKESFMKLELEAVDDFLLSSSKPFVMSLGGGASDNIPLMERIAGEGKLIYLHRRESDMLPIILRDGIPPFLDEDDVEGSFHRLYEKGDSIYRKYADLTVELGPYTDIQETFDFLTHSLEEDRS